MPTQETDSTNRKSDAEGMSDVRAIFVSDLHLQARPPVARAGEADWFEAMAKPMRELRTLAKKHHNAAVVYAGDIFDRWNAGPEVINFALRELPAGYAIPGQHDLPNHSYAEIRRSAYWTLVEAGLLYDISNESVGHTLTCELHGYPWGTPIEPVEKEEGKVKIAVAHSFIWCKRSGYPGAPLAARASAYKKALAGYDVAVFGDNHKGFLTKFKDGPWVFNCGGFMRRKIDEISYRPRLGLLYGDGIMGQYYLDLANESVTIATDAEYAVNKVLDMSEFVEDLLDLESGEALNFLAALKRFIESNGVTKEVEGVIMTATDNGE